MTPKTTITKFLILIAAVVLFGIKVSARPEYLKIFATDSSTRPELRSQCSVCHIDPEGGGPRNAFGKAFAAAGLEITPELRKQFPNRFRSTSEDQKPSVTFVEGSDSEAIVEVNGKKFVINTKSKTVTEQEGAKSTEKIAAAAPGPEKNMQEDEEIPKIYRQHDVRLVNLPTARPIPKGALLTDFTHRFPFGDPVSGSSLLGLDTGALPSFGLLYGITDRFHVGAYRSPGDLGRPILLYAGARVFGEEKGDPFTLMARVGLEGQDNFKRNFTTSFELTFARSITRHAQVYVVPTISVGDRRLNFDPEKNLPSLTAHALGFGVSVNIRPSVALMVERNHRLNGKSRYIVLDNLGREISGIRHAVWGFGIQKTSVSRRHTFSLTFSNGPGTTFAQRSMTRGLYGADDSLHGLSIGFNLSRRLF